jgi:hypothetical protein
MSSYGSSWDGDHMSPLFPGDHEEAVIQAVTFRPWHEQPAMQHAAPYIAVTPNDQLLNELTFGSVERAKDILPAG